MTQGVDVSAGFVEILGVLRRRRMLIAAIGLAIIVIASALALGLPDVYRSQATFTLLQVEEGKQASDRDLYADEFVYSLTDRVKRSAQLQDVARELEPYPELAGQSEEVLSRLRDDISVNMITEELRDPRTGRALEAFKGFAVTYSNRSPDMAVRVLERLAPVYAEISRATALERAQHDISFLTAEAESKRGEIIEQEKRLAEFKGRNFDKLPEVAQANINLRAQIDREVEAIERELRGVRQNRVFLLQQLQQEQSGPAVGNLRQLEDEYNRKSAIYAVDHPDVVALRRQIDNLRRTGPGVTGSSLQAELEGQRAALAEARQRYSEEHPDIRRLMRSIEALEARIAAGESATASRSATTAASVQLQTQLNAIDTQIDGLQVRSAQLRNQLLNLDTKLGATPEVEREYESLTRDIESARQLYEQLTDKRMAAEFQAAVIGAGTLDRFRLLDQPSRPSKPSQPARIRIFIIGLFLATIVALGSAVAAELMDPSVRGSRDVRSVLQVTPLALVPEIRNSVYAQRHKRRLSLLAATVVVGAPLAFVIVRLISS